MTIGKEKIMQNKEIVSGIIDSGTEKQDGISSPPKGMLNDGGTSTPIQSKFFDNQTISSSLNGSFNFSEENPHGASSVATKHDLPYGDNISVKSFRSEISKLRFPNGMENKPYNIEFDLSSFLQDYPTIVIDDVGIKEANTGIDEVSIADNVLHISGTPLKKGAITIWLEYHISNNGENTVTLSENMQSFMILSDPKKLWKNLPPDPEAPFQTPNEDSIVISGIIDKTLVCASKRGRSHAHEGKFRDDCFKAKWLKDVGWLLVAVSDGAGSAEFSRKGASIACSTFIDELTIKLSDKEINLKIDAIFDEKKQGQALEHLLLTVAHKAAMAIKDYAQASKLQINKFSATFLGYIAKQIKGQWLITAVGIGDGAIAIIEEDNKFQLLNLPDGGEYVGQTRFLTTPDVWKGLTTPEAWKQLQNRANSVRCKELKYVFSMTDGVSDPMFETDNNLRDVQKWLDFINVLTVDSENPVNLVQENEFLAEELNKWLDFWSKGNYDDRTLTILF